MAKDTNIYINHGSYVCAVPVLITTRHFIEVRTRRMDDCSFFSIRFAVFVSDTVAGRCSAYICYFSDGINNIRDF